MRAVVCCRDSNGVPTLVPVRCRVPADSVQEGDHYESIGIALAEQEGYERIAQVIDEDDFHALAFGLKEIFEAFDWDTVVLLDCADPEV